MGGTRLFTRHNLPSLVIGMLAVVLALSGTAYALGKGEVKTANLANGAVTTPKLAAGAVTTHKLAHGAVTSDQVGNRSLRLHDIGGPYAGGMRETATDVSIPANSCRTFFLVDLEPTNGLLGAMVIGQLTDPDGDAVLDNDGVVVPTIVSGTTMGDPGEVQLNLLVCDGGGSGQSVPAGSVFTYRVLGL